MRGGGRPSSYTGHLSRRLGPSLPQAARWRRRFGFGSLRALEDESSARKTKRGWHPDPLVLERMLALRRRYPHWDKETLAAVYSSWYGERISPWQFQRMIRQFRMTRPSRRGAGNRRRHRTVKQRTSYATRRNARQLWQLDTVALQSDESSATSLPRSSTPQSLALLTPTNAPPPGRRPTACLASPGLPASQPACSDR
jgi:hypothetical protein